MHAGTHHHGRCRPFFATIPENGLNHYSNKKINLIINNDKRTFFYPIHFIESSLRNTIFAHDGFHTYQLFWQA